jgi:hypothetical protein
LDRRDIESGAGPSKFCRRSGRRSRMKNGIAVEKEVIRIAFFNIYKADYK